jgi:hypothetical protein
MRIREEDRNMFLLAALALFCTVVAGTIALLEPVSGQVPEQRGAQNRSVNAAALAPVRVVGAPFVLNVNPRER